MRGDLTVLNDDDDAREIRLRKKGKRDASHSDHPADGQQDDDRDDRAPLGIDDAAEVHGSAAAAGALVAEEMATLVPSGNP